MTAVEDAECMAVAALGERIGFGRIMQLCEELWRKRDPVGALTVGPVAAIKDRERSVEMAVAKQLQRSMELNARMKKRLAQLEGRIAVTNIF